LRDDDQCFVTSWGFDPSTITVPVGVWFGDADTMVPPSHGVWLSEAIPTASARRMPREGHISLVTNYQNDIADFLRKVGV
jgi:pimeloyl-ACP methyl ester carboxylesterase